MKNTNQMSSDKLDMQTTDLVNQNFEKLTKSIELLYRDEKLYTTCKSNANSSVQKFSFEKITEEFNIPSGSFALRSDSHYQ